MKLQRLVKKVASMRLKGFIVILYVVFWSMWFSIVQTQLHFICMSGNFW